VIIGGNTAASYAACHGAEVLMIEKDIGGGAAHVWDCISSKSMIATGDVSPRIDVDNLSTRLASIEDRIHPSTQSLLEN
jgi:pyruvate/2-oxoglutarate dehydrogenase complex dihydrolipoamide dehydrogenase (E3) component